MTLMARLNRDYTPQMAIVAVALGLTRLLNCQLPARNRDEGAALLLAPAAAHSTAQVGQFPLRGNAARQKHLRGQYLGTTALAANPNVFGGTKV